MPAVSSVISCVFPSSPLFLKTQRPSVSSFLLSLPRLSQVPRTKVQAPRRIPCPETPFVVPSHPISPFHGRFSLHMCRNSMETENREDPVQEEGLSMVENSVASNGNARGLSDWATSILLFALWAALMYYVFFLTPDQTPRRDMYFLKKLLNLIEDDGFRMNEVLVSLWYIMGLWPLVYGMLLIPCGRSSRRNVLVWPFLLLSFFGGAYALLPYFVLWRPAPPSVNASELGKWPLSFLESKITAGILLAAGLGITAYAGLANGDVWKEFFQYFRESKFIHITCIDFLLLSAFAPFWVYNDMSARKWYDKGSWLLPVTPIPFLGPALYLILRPTLSVEPANIVNES